MSKTHKTNLAQRVYSAAKEKYRKYVKGEGPPPYRHESGFSWEEKNKTGQRYGNNRKMWAKMKVHERRAERKKNNQTDD